jgi:hypothetical protein
VGPPAPDPSNIPKTTTAAQSRITPPPLPPPPPVQIPRIDFDSLLSSDFWLDELCRSGAMGDDMGGDMQAMQAMTS